MIQLKGTFRGVLAAVGTAALICLSLAQGRVDRPKSFNTTMEGRGTVHFDGSTYHFNQLQLTLQNNGRLTVHALLYAPDGRDIVFSGKARDFSRRGHRLSADIQDVGYGRDNDSADAFCDIDVSSNDRFNTVTITGQNTTDNNDLTLDFISNGKVVTDFQGPDRDRDRDHDHGDRDHGGQNNWPGNADLRAAGRYTDSEEWRRRGQHFLLRYTLTLERDGDARLVADSIEDRNMPNDQDARHDKGDILKYLQHGDNVVETGHWSQRGDEVTITFTNIEYGDTSRSKKEVWGGHMRGSSIIVDDFEKSFYGHDVDLSFEKS